MSTLSLPPTITILPAHLRLSSTSLSKKPPTHRNHSTTTLPNQPRHITQNHLQYTSTLNSTAAAHSDILPIPSHPIPVKVKVYLDIIIIIIIPNTTLPTNLATSPKNIYTSTLNSTAAAHSDILPIPSHPIPVKVYLGIIIIIIIIPNDFSTHPPFNNSKHPTTSTVRMKKKTTLRADISYVFQLGGTILFEWKKPPRESYSR